MHCKILRINPSIDISRTITICSGIGKERLKCTGQNGFCFGNLWTFFDIGIVSAHIPIILGVDDIDILLQHFQNRYNRLIHEDSGSHATTLRYCVHAIVKWDPHIRTKFSTSEPYRLHRRTGHPSTDKQTNFKNHSAFENDSGLPRKLWNHLLLAVTPVNALPKPLADSSSS